MAAPGNIDRPFNGFNAAFRNKLNERREARVRYRAPFYLLWDEQFSPPNYVKALSNEVSEHGMSLETTRSIPVGTQLALRSESGALCGSALVKHAAKRGAKHLVGVQLGYSLLDEALALVREVYGSPSAK